MLGGAVDLVSTDRDRSAAPWRGSNRAQRERTCESGYEENVPA
jgi:hypothetical protein